MKFLRIGPPGQERPACLDQNGNVRDLSSIFDDLAGQNLAPEKLAALRNVDIESMPAIRKNERVGPCVSGTRNFIAVGLNYSDHAAESGMAIPSEPVLFNKAPSCIIGPNDPIQLPKGSKKVDWEVELAIVIGKDAYFVDEAEARNIIAGYCVCNDVSERYFQLECQGQWTKGKGCPTFGPLGPWLVTPDEIPDVQALSMWLDVNGQKMQSGSTATMIFSAHYLVSYISRFMLLQPGDVITTGTPPGVGLGKNPPQFLSAGDEIRLGISSLGEQRQMIVRAGA